MSERPFYDLLPELYKQDKLLDTILAVFEEQYLKIEKTIDELPDVLYNPDRATSGWMDFLWEMFGMDNCGAIFSYKQKRELIPLMYVLQSRKGTRKALDWILKAFLSDLCGYWVNPIIMEYDSWCDYECSENLKHMYLDSFGGEDYFVVLIPPEPALQTQDAKKRIQILIEEYSPVDAVPRIIAPESYTALDRNAYLGFGTRI